jgi:crotonobetainyl-CoA:carnitine CoA-transferase CaiB-like acyl-CoA transferase
VTSASPLSGLKVVDISHLAAGPWCTMVLADLGAEVIKVERPGSGDMSRQAGSVFVEDQSAVFLGLNRNKRSVALDLRDEAALAVFRRMVEEADVVVENLRPGKADELGVGYAALSAWNPAIVYASISAFGADGPNVKLPGNDPIIQAMSGAMDITGEEGGPPARQGVSVPDFGAGMMAGLAILAAVHGRDRTGKGCHVELNLLDVSVFALGPRAQEYLIDGREQPRLGSAHPQFAPYQAYRCGGGDYLYVAIINDKFWLALCAALDRPDLARHPDFATNPDRTARRVQLAEMLEPVFGQRDRDHWLAVLSEHGVPCGPVNTLSEALTDPQIQHNRLLQSVHHPVVGELSTVGVPMRFDGQRPGVRSAPPLLGEHTAAVLSELGIEVDVLGGTAR